MSSGFSTPRLLGAALVILGAGGAGFLAYRAHRADAPILTAAPVAPTGPAVHPDPTPVPEAALAKKTIPTSLPDISLADMHGKSTRLASFGGRPLMVNFWATWCAPCLEEMPSIERLRRSLDARRFAVLAVNVGEGPRVAGDFAKKMGLGFNFLLDRDLKASKAWGARVLPATFIVDPDGKVRYSHFGALDWSSAEVRKLVAGLVVE